MRRIVEINHEDVVGRAFMLLIQTTRSLFKTSDRLFSKTLHLSTVKYIVLKALSLSGGTLTPTDLSNWTGTERTNITALVARMQKEGLVAYKRSEEDKRVVHIALTEKGRDLLERANQVATDMIEQVMKNINKLKAAQLEKILLVIQKNIYMLDQNPNST